MLYDYLCRQCGFETEAANRIAERHTNAPVCCSERMDIIIKTAPYGFRDREVYYECPVTGQHVTTRRQRNNIMAEHDLMDANDLVNKKTIQQTIDKAEERRKVAEAHRLPNHLKGKFESLRGVMD